LAILEDANHHTAQLTAVRVDEMEQKEEELLVTAKSWMGRIPFDLDILVLDEIGKTISGAGMDTKVVNRSVQGQYNPWDTAPKLERLFVRGISEHSYGNGVGLGMADVIHDRMLKQIDWNPTRINSLTASTPAAIRTPVYYPTDRMCLEKIAPTVGKLKMTDVTIGWIRNSLELGSIALTANLRKQIEGNPNLEIVGETEWPFDSHDDLPALPSVAAHAAAH
jgi:hypothetical protein